MLHTIWTSGWKMLTRKYREGSKGFAHRTLKARQSFHRGPGIMAANGYYRVPFSWGVWLSSPVNVTMSSARKKRQNGPTAICPNLCSSWNAVHILYLTWFEQKARFPHSCPEGIVGKWIWRRSSELLCSRPVNSLVARRLGTLRITLDLITEKRQWKIFTTERLGFLCSCLLARPDQYLCVCSDLGSLNFSPGGSRKKQGQRSSPLL